MKKASASAQERLGSLSKDKAQLLRLLLEEKSRQAQRIKSCPRPAEGGKVRLPTSWAQQRLWLIDRLEGGTAVYNMSEAVRLRGELDERLLQRALDTLVQRHEILRTGFVEVEGIPLQEILPERRFPLRTLDLQGYEEAEREALIRQHRSDERHEKFDLHNAPLIRGRLLRVKPAEYVLLLTMHHLISDGWSLGVMWRELSEIYEAYEKGRDNPLQPLPIQYADYAHWQRQWFQGERLEKQLSYWCTRLQGAAPQLQLPTDRPRPAVQSFRGQQLAIELDRSLTARLRAFAQQHDMTLFMVLYSGWAILLSRLSGGQEDVLIGTPIANRQRPELESLIGLFVNTLVLRLTVQGSLTLKEFLGQVREVTLGAYDHQDLPFEQVVEALQPERSLSRNPLFQVWFSLQSTRGSEVRLASATATFEAILDGPAMFDLLLQMEERDEDIVGIVNYAADLFDRETIERWMACFTALLTAISEGIETRLQDLPILPASERESVLERFNATETPYPREKLIHQLIEEQVARTPGATAVVHEDQSLSYWELNERANQLARHLRENGIGPDQLVGICVERGLNMVVSLLGILKAGGAYVPLDPGYPPERLAYLLEDAAPGVLLTEERIRASLPRTPAKVISFDNDWPEIARQPTDNLDAATLGLRSDHLAYVIYTSGSTGKPKGVAIEHRNTVNLICWAHQVFPQDLWERVLHSTSLNFDLSVYECFVPLSTGGTLHVVENALTLLKEPAQVTLINTVPSAISAVLQSGTLPATTRVVNLAGEALKKELVERIFAQTRVERVCNLYGPSETTTYSTWIEMPRQEGFNPTIGRPIANTRIYVLDRHHQPVPIGVPGEIYIGGDGVARGYLHRSELTSERFIKDPFGHDPHGRMYKTGDLGRWRADGTLEYIGRNDSQVKVRGYRIELGEIEAQLTHHSRVKEAVVLAREDVPGEKRLVAYLTQRTPQQDTEQNAPSLRIEELRVHLKAVLPEYMIPSSFVLLEHLPLTANGKVDRRALPAPQSRHEEMAQYVPPRTELERRLAEIFAQVLQLEQVGIHDNFFKLGGHSLLATRVISRIRDVFTVDLPLRVLFDTPTLEALAERIQAEQKHQELQETRHAEQLTADFRKQIDVMADEAVWERIAELEAELASAPTHTNRQAPYP